MSDAAGRPDDLEEPDSLEARLPELIASGAIAQAARLAIERQLALGLPITFARGQEVIQLYPDGHEEILDTIVPFPEWTPSNTFIPAKPAGERASDQSIKPDAAIK